MQRYKELLEKFENDPVSKQIHDGVIDSLYDEFKLGNSELCDPWKFLTQDIEIERVICDYISGNHHHLHKISLMMNY